jgi:excisionase family DNA binding protein
MRSFDELPDVLQVKDVIQYLRLSKAVVYELIHKNKIHSVRAGSRILIPKTAVKKFIEDRYNEDQ